MAKKKEDIKEEEKIIKTEPVETEENDLATEGVSDEEKIDVEAPEVIINSDEEKKEDIKEEEKITLIIEVAFSDKYTGVDYKIGDEISFEKNRAIELLNDTRKLVHKK